MTRRLLEALLALTLFTCAAAAQERLPDGGVAEAAGHGAVRAWYGRPTGRYGHGVLGDAIEGGSLVAVDEAGRRDELVLGGRHVFEDVTPRLADLDGDGRIEIVTIRSDVSAGAAVAVYEMRDGRLGERAATAPIGRSNRWLSVAAIADFTGDGRREVAVVKTPHIGGRLEVLALRGDRLEALFPARGDYSTHFIGSRDVSLAAAADLDGDGAAELVLPDQERRRVIVLTLRGGVREIFAQDVPARVARPLRIEGGERIVAPLEDGTTAVLEPR